ncbi:hypothetical protein WJX81_001606 [Elliptochloris bilobata]|uniref:microtubule-severing ATPase n=1 Tax=Elliptochloris bilobata TaxID=381761 RepID=A0AAW1RWS8_9CHLO
MLAYVVDLAVSLSLRTMQWLFGSGGGTQPARAALRPAQKGIEPSLQANQEKLKGYHDLAQDAIERAYNKDVEGASQDAIKLYRLGLNIIYEGLSLRTPSAGLGPAFSNVERWKEDMKQWLQRANDRLRDLEAPDASTSARGGAVAPAQCNPLAPTLAASTTLLRTRTTSQSSTGTPRVPAATPGGRGPGGAAAGGAAGREDARLREVVLGEILDTRPSTRWDDVAGLSAAKQALAEMVILPTLRADLFNGLRAPARGLLLYGPPGNGKTLLAKALAAEARATFFAISASSLTSKWHGEAEKLVRTLFAVAAEMQPSVIFIDEIDSILSERTAGEHEASRRLKTQFLVEFDGVAASSERVVVIGATNRPQELDEAVRRRLVKRVYIPMPDAAGRRELLWHVLAGQPARLSRADVEALVGRTGGYSGSDLAALCREAAMVPLRELGPALSTVSADQVRPIQLRDFEAALQTIRPSVGPEQLAAFEDWTRAYGSSGGA